MPALDRTGKILVADPGDRARDFGFRGIVQFDDRQAGGRRHEPSRHSAYFNAAGLSLVSAAVSRPNRLCKYRADCNRPCLQLLKIAWHRSGVTFDTSDMQPSPPLAMKASAVASSPDNSRNAGGSNGCRRMGRVKSPVPSRNPMNCGDFASRARVSSDSSRMVREGTSCRMMGREVETAIARKCAWMPACIGLL